MNTSTVTARIAAQPKLRCMLRALTVRTRSTLDGIDWAAPLAGRFAVGLLFAGTGWGKVHDLENVAAFFTSLHIPLPGFHAVLVGYSELVCGAALVLGLATRLATLPLIVSMIVAILTARAGDVGGALDLVGLEEFTYLTVLSMLLVSGPGRVSVDHLLARRLLREGA